MIEVCKYRRMHVDSISRARDLVSARGLVRVGGGGGGACLRDKNPAQ